MSKLYVPTYDNESCVVVLDSNTIRVYDSQLSINTEIDFTDYFVNSHYMEKKGKQTFSSIEEVPTCLDHDVITDSFYNRNDLFDILAIFLIILIVCIYFPFRIFSRMFGRWLKV